MSTSQHHPTKLERLARQCLEDLRDHPQYAYDPEIRPKLLALHDLLADYFKKRPAKRKRSKPTPQ